MNIIGVDHIQFAVRDVAACVQYLSRHGYGLDFQETAFNTEARSYFHGTGQTLAYLHRGSSRLEVISSAGDGVVPHYAAVLDGFEFPDTAPAFLSGDLRAFWRESLSCCCLAKDSDVPTLSAVVLRANRLQPSSTFWQSLGFRTMPQAGPQLSMGFPCNMMSMPLTIHVVDAVSDPIVVAKADDPGCTSVALITRDLCSDRTELAQAGYATSETTSFRINRRPVRVCFISGPSGELVELVEFGRT
jgi:hypothetical protein